MRCWWLFASLSTRAASSVWLIVPWPLDLLPSSYPFCFLVSDGLAKQGHVIHCAYSPVCAFYYKALIKCFGFLVIKPTPFYCIYEVIPRH